MAEQSGSYGANGEYAFVPAAVGFFLGGGFVYAADVVMDWIGVQSPVDMGEQNLKCQDSQETILQIGISVPVPSPWGKTR